MKPENAASEHPLCEGVCALPGGLLWLESSAVLVAADAHLAYEDVIGGALPLWSTGESVGVLQRTARRLRAREIVLLGDVIHGTRMSDGAAAVVAGALASLRAERIVTIVAGNHEGRSRGVGLLGDTEEAIERDGWVLVHGDQPVTVARCIIGHLHPSLPLGGGARVPVFLASAHFIVVPALTPYSDGLNVLGRECRDTLRRFGVETDIAVVASSEDKVYPFGALAKLRSELRFGGARRLPPLVRQRRLRSDRP